jgi:uncharacterized membrane protein YphA (DoxX/SURF4 family)
MDVVFLIGRILFVVPFVTSGIMNHLLAGSRAVEYARSMPVRPPAPELFVPLSGLVIVLGGISVAAGIWGDLGAILLGGFAGSVAPFAHAFWRIDDPAESANQMAHFFKNVGLLGGAIILFWLFNQAQDPPLTITDALFDRID